MDVAKGHQAQIREAQVAADELVTHAQQAQREAQREAASWRAQVLPAATCTAAAECWGSQTRRMLLPAHRTDVCAPVLAKMWKAAASSSEIAALCATVHQLTAGHVQLADI